MYMKSIITAAAIAVLPMVASAATFIEDGNSYAISEGSQFFGDAEAGEGGAGCSRR